MKEIVGLWRNREFGLLWGGQVLSELGSQLPLVAYALRPLAPFGHVSASGPSQGRHTITLMDLYVTISANRNHYPHARDLQQRAGVSTKLT